MKKERYFIDCGPIALLFELARALNDGVACKLDDNWRMASAVIVDSTFVAGVEEKELIAQSNVSRKLASAIIGKSLPAFASARGAGADGTCMPFPKPASSTRRRVAAESVSKTLKADLQLKLGWPSTGVWP
jgi:hypothetical protein